MVARPPVVAEPSLFGSPIFNEYDITAVRVSLLDPVRARAFLRCP